VRLCKYAKQPDDYMGDNFPHFERHPITSSRARATTSNMERSRRARRSGGGRPSLRDGPHLRSGLYGEGNVKKR
jgi:hypothetical protein